MKKRLTLAIDEALIKRAKLHSKKRGKTLSQTVADYFAVMGAPIEVNKEDLHPDVRSLVGILKGYDKLGYDGVLEQRYLYENEKPAAPPYALRTPRAARRKADKSKKKRLTLTIDAELIRRAKPCAQEYGKTLSQAVADYFALMDAPVEADKAAPRPDMRSLVGILRDIGVDERDYYEYLERKYS